MANIRLAVATRTAMTTALLNLLDAGATGATIKLYNNTQPATGDTALSGNTLLATLTASVTAGVSASGVLTFNAITQDASADNAGTATWARIQDSNGLNIFDCDVATGGATITIDNASIVAGAPVSMSSFTITMPAS